VLEFLFTRPNPSAARALADGPGGEIFDENRRGPGFVVCDATEPEDNVFQILEDET
jgi:hypothetical protein